MPYACSSLGEYALSLKEMINLALCCLNVYIFVERLEAGPVARCVAVLKMVLSGLSWLPQLEVSVSSSWESNALKSFVTIPLSIINR